MSWHDSRSGTPQNGHKPGGETRTRRQRTNLHALVRRQQLQTELVRCKALPTLFSNDMVYRPLGVEMLLAVHDVHSQPRQRAVERLRGERLPFLFLARTLSVAAGFAPLGRLAHEDDLGRERDHLLYEVIWGEVAPQLRVGSPGGIRALDEHGREVVWDLGRCCPPDGDVPRFDGDAVRLDVAKKEEFVLGGDVFDEEAGAFVRPVVVLAMTDRHSADRDIGKYRLVFTIDMQTGRRGHRWAQTDRLVSLRCIGVFCVERKMKGARDSRVVEQSE